MSAIYSVRARFDTYIYWAVFLFIVVFVAYFLTSMIKLADADSHEYEVSTMAGYRAQAAKARHHSAVVNDEEWREAPADAIAQ